MDNINYIYDVIFSLDHQKGTSSTQESNQATDRKKGCQTAKTKLNKKIKASVHHFANAAMFTAFVRVLIIVVRVGARRRRGVVTAGCVLGVGCRGWVQGLRF